MKSWKTSACGLIGAAGVALAASDNPKLKLAGQIITALGIGGIGMVSRDNSVTSEQAGAVKDAPKPS